MVVSARIGLSNVFLIKVLTTTKAITLHAFLIMCDARPCSVGGTVIAASLLECVIISRQWAGSTSPTL